MLLNRERSSAKYQITKYNLGVITVNDVNYTDSILVMPDYLAPWGPKNLSDLDANSIVELLALKPEVILLGTGAELTFPAAEILQVATTNKVGIEVMTTQAACRTYAVLVAEGRRVLAALILGQTPI